MDNVVEIIGYVASFIILVSLLMSSVKRLRMINLFGSMIFTGYGFAIESYPTAIMNLGIVAIDLYYLIKLQRTKDRFKIVELSNDSKLLSDFMECYKKDIELFMDVNFDFDNIELKKYFITRNTIPAGLFIGRVDGENMEVYLDYTTPMYRDYKVGQYLYDSSYEFYKYFGVVNLVSKPGQPKHESYLEKMGFKKIEIDGQILMKKQIKKQ